MKVKYKHYKCEKCQIYKHVSVNEHFDGICKCCKNKMEFLRDSIEDTNITPSKIEENGRINRERWERKCEEEKRNKIDNTQRCITCRSTNLKKISVSSKAGSVFMWGIFATGRINKTWHCNNCGTEW